MARNIAGALASNAGDEFHELWALRECLRLVSNTSDLRAVTLEGVAVAGPVVDGGAEWDGVDCALYYGGESLEAADRIDLLQLKYSSANELPAWTVSSLLGSTAKAPGNNSVARKLGKAFLGAADGRTEQYVQENIAISLITNRPISADLLTLIAVAASGENTQAVEGLRQATGLDGANFIQFCHALKLQGGAEASPRLRVNAVEAIANITDAEVKGTLSELRMRVKERMLPAGARTPIDRQTVLTWLNTGIVDGLFPCPPEFEPLGEVILDDVLFFADICRGAGCSAKQISKLINNAWPKENRTWEGYPSKRNTDFTFRSQLSLAALRGEDLSLAQIFNFDEGALEKSETDTEDQIKQKAHQKERLTKMNEIKTPSLGGKWRYGEPLETVRAFLGHALEFEYKLRRGMFDDFTQQYEGTRQYLGPRPKF